MTSRPPAPPADPQAADSSVPPGRWGVGVSGGADSVALLELLRTRSDLTLHVIHLDHETREGESAKDAEFVRDFAAACGLAATIARRSEIESAIARLPANPSARFRAARLELFAQVVSQQQLQGVILAHHADDQAETILQRLLRGSGPAGLTGMSMRTVIRGVTIVRPLLGVSRSALRQVLVDRGLHWREDASNQSPLQQRNRARRMLTAHAALSRRLLELGDACAELIQWLREQSPQLRDVFHIGKVLDLSPPVAREALREWLVRQSGAGTEVPSAACERLLEMIADRATPARQHFPGGLLVRRRGDTIVVDHGAVVEGRVDAADSAS